MIEKMKKIFLYFSLVFIIAGVSFITAYNWNEMGNITKISIPLSLITLGIVGWFVFQNKKIYRELSILFASFFVGTLFATYGQIYQTGADSYKLFLSWGLMILLFSCVEKFYPLWFLNVVVLTTGLMLYIGLFKNLEIVIFSGAIIISFFILIYIIGIKKFKLPQSDWFLYSLMSITLSFSTIVIVYNLLHYKASLTMPDFYKGTLNVFYLIILLLTYIIGKKMKKEGAMVMVILSITIVIIVAINRGSIEIEKIYLGIIILISSIVFIINKFVTSKGIRLIVNILKVILSIFILLFILLIGSLAGISIRSLIIISGVLLMIISCLLPKIMKFKESKSEIVTFILGTLLILLYLKEFLHLSSLLVTFFGYLIYFGFWHYKHSKELDYLVVPCLSLGLWFATNKYYNSYSINSLSSIQLLISVIFIFLSLFYKGRKKDLVERATTGAALSLMSFSFMFYIAKNSNTYGFIEFNYPIKGLLLLIVLKVLYEVVNRSGKVRYTVLLCGLISFMFFINLNMLGIGIGVMIILLYLYKENNFMLCVGVLFLMSCICYYYYSLDMTLMEKSFMLLKTGGVSFVLFLVLKWRFRVEGEENEKEISIR